MDMDLSKYVADVQLTEAEKSVLTFLLTHLDEALKLGVRGIAKANFTSTSTVMRLAKKLGYNGFIEMYYKLLGKAEEEKPNYEVNEGFANQFLQENLLSLSMYPRVRQAAQQICETNRLVFIYGMVFSALMAEYLAKKLLVLGIKCIFSDGADSIGIFENNLEDIGVLIVFSRSGRSRAVLNRVKTAKENAVFTVAFTGDSASPLKDLADCVIEAQDDTYLDDRNMKPTLFFSKTLMLIELLIYEYYGISIQKHK